MRGFLRGWGSGEGWWEGATEDAGGVGTSDASRLVAGGLVIDISMLESIIDVIWSWYSLRLRTIGGVVIQGGVKGAQILVSKQLGAVVILC